MNVHGKNQGAAGEVDIETQNNYFGGNQPTLPNSIPSVIGFVGREDYLTDLRRSYQNGALCFVLHGTGGVGKTALALQFAGEIAGEYAARVFVEMNGMSEKPLSARDAMLDVVRQFERDIPTDISDAQLKGLFVQFVQNQKTLIVLDNAENKQAVEDLKRAKACFITTSREAFTLTSADGGKKILQMSPKDAQDLLFEIAGENRFDNRAGELAQMAGYLPVALKPLASILAEDELETAADLIKRYGDKKELLKQRVPDYENRTIEASFELSYEALPAELKERWRRLSVFPADFDETAMAAILDIPADEARETQKQLRRFSLLEVNPETKRFNLHDLARVFADAKLSDDERFQAQFQFAKHYASILLTAQIMREEQQENYYLNALKLIDTEWSNTRTGQKWAAELIERDNDIAELCTDYSGYARDFISLRLHPRENITWMETGLKAAQKLGNRQNEGKSLGNLGIAYNILGDYRKAIEFYEQALTISRDTGARLDEGSILGNLGIAYKNLGEYQKAIEFHEQALEISREIGSRLGESQDLCNLGSTYYRLGDYRKAINYYEQQLTISRDIGNRLIEGASLSGLGIVYDSLGEYQKAIEFHEQHLVISREIGDLLGEANSLSNMGSAYNSIGEKEKACGLLKAALMLFEAIESPNANHSRQWIKENCEE